MRHCLQANHRSSREAPSTHGSNGAAQTTNAMAAESMASPLAVPTAPSSNGVQPSPPVRIAASMCLLGVRALVRTMCIDMCVDVCTDIRLPYATALL